MDYNKEVLARRIDIAYLIDDKDYERDATIENALDIFKQIKKIDKFNPDGERDLNGEFSQAEHDLKFIFGINHFQYKNLTKNQFYLFHQSKMVNAIYDFLRGEK